MKRVLLFSLAVLAVNAQTSMQTINNEAMSSARVKINSNFSALNGALVATPATAQILQPSTDVVSLTVKQPNTTNTADIFNVLDKAANKDLVVDVNGMVLHRNGEVASVAAYTGADFGAKANACLAAIPTGGTCQNANAVSGTVTTSTTITVPAGKTLMLGGITLNSSANPVFAINDSSQIIGQGRNQTIINATTSGATVIQAQCLGSCGSAITGMLIRGLKLVAGTSNTGIGIDFTAMYRTHFTDLTISGFGTGATNSLTCASPGCYYDNWDNVNVIGTTGSTGMWFKLSANAHDLYGVRFSHALNQLLVGDVGSSAVTNEIHCFGCTFEGPDLMSPPSAPTIGGTGGSGAACVEVEYVTQAGFTLPSTESCINTLNGTNLTVTSPASVAGALGYAVFAGATTGTEKLNIAAGTCTTVSVNGGTYCQLGSDWAQNGVLSITTRIPETYQSAGAAVSVVRGSGIDLFGGRCEPGNAATCIQTYPDNLAGAVIVDGMRFQFSTGASRPILDQSGLVVQRTNNTQIFTDFGIRPQTTNLIDNYSFEGWTSTTQALGWNSLATTNWANATMQTRTTSNVHSGAYAMAIGDTNTLNRGVATQKIPVDPTYSYSLSFNWATANTQVGIRYGIREIDATGATITDSSLAVYGTVANGAGGTYTSGSMSFSSSFNAFVIGSNLTQSSINTLSNVTRQFKLSPNTAYIQVGFWAVGTAVAGSTTVYLDDIVLAQGTIPSVPADALQSATNFAKPLPDSATGGNVQVQGGMVSPMFSTTLGSAIASGDTIAPTVSTFHVTGTTTVNTITPPLFCLTGSSCRLNIIPDGIFSTGTTGNIALASTSVVSKVLMMSYDPGTSKWYPSY